jgi:hypothetical protein
MQPPAAWPGAEPLQFRLNGEEAAGEAPQFRYFPFTEREEIGTETIFR